MLFAYILTSLFTVQSSQTFLLTQQKPSFVFRLHRGRKKEKLKYKLKRTLNEVKL